MKVLTRCLWILLIWPGIACWAGPAQISQYKLKNGLQILVKPDHRSEAAVVQLWYKVGSSYEPAGKSGMSHLLEHMMFQGSKNMSPKELKQRIESIGGNINAMTSYDGTMYYEKVPRKQLEQALSMEAERMVNLAMTSRRFQKEKQVVLEELRLRTKDQPQALAHQRLQAAAQIAHPYHHPIGGWFDDVKHLTLNDLKQWYRQWYSPNNAVLVVAGHVKPKRIYKLARKHFGGLKPSRKPELHFQKQPPPKGEKTVTVHAPAKLPWLGLAYQLPVYKTARNQNEAYALQVLQAVLAMGRNSQLQRSLVREQQLASDVQCGYDPWRMLNGQFECAAVPANGVSMDKMKQALYKEIAKLSRQALSERELKRAKRQLIASDTFQLDSLFYQAFELGKLAIVDLPPQLLNNWRQRVEGVTASQVKAAASHYLVPLRRTSAVLVPQALNSASGGDS